MKPDNDVSLNLSRLVDRRTVLRLLAGAGVVTLVGCSSSNGTASSRSPIPEETAGPFPGDGSNGPNVLTEPGIVRRDITSSFGSASATADGVPATIELTLVDTGNDSAALADAAVYIWHCDREGRYSLYSDGVTDENYLRGVQASDERGVVTFQTIFPAGYSPRWPHIHFEVFASLDDATSGGDKIATSQIALPASACNAVFATDGYEQSAADFAPLSLESDSVFGDDGGVRELATVTGNVNDGYVIALTVPV